MIISLFGPDGVGKSTISELFRTNGLIVFSGTGISTWPDTSWHDKLAANGIDESRLDSDRHFLEKIRRCHDLARSLQTKQSVVIDSDPLHKTLMHDYLRALPDKQTAKLKVNKRFKEFKGIANLNNPANHLHILFQISDTLTPGEQAKILQNRIGARGTLMPFDPHNLETSLRMIEACQVIKDTLVAAGERLLVVSTDKTITSEELKKWF